MPKSQTTAKITPFEQIDKDRWATIADRPDRFAAWTNGDYVAQGLTVAGGITRLAIHRTVTKIFGIQASPFTATFDSRYIS